MDIDQNRLVHDELQYDANELSIELQQLMSTITPEQKEIFNSIMNAAARNKEGMFFIYGFGGTGKTFLWRALSAALRSEGEIVLTVASSGIASLLIPGGKTAHSRFSIPLNITEDSACNIKQGSQLADLLTRTKLII